MNIALIGLPHSGKTTVFNALTGLEADTESYSGGKVEPNVAVVQVVDERVDELSELYQPKKRIFATIELIDFAGLTGSGAEAFSPEALNRIKGCDALAIVLRNFSDPGIDAELGEAAPAEDFETVYGEMLITDQIVAEKRIERVAEDRKKGKKTGANPREEKVLSRIVETLEGGEPVRSVELDEEAARIVSGFQFLTGKPAFVVLNSDEQRYGKATVSLPLPVIEFAGLFESELSRMEQEEAKEFMQDAGMTESARSRLTTFAYEILGYISFFTVGPDEVRAWTLRKGGTAVDAAGTIHSDLARGFIRAECFRCEDILEHKSEKELKKLGKVRLEGKEYLVDDGDILSIRFSV